MFIASPLFSPLLQSPGKEGLQPAKALVTLNTADVHRQDSVMSVLTVCQRQLESELFLVKNEMRSSAEARGQVRCSGGVGVGGGWYVGTAGVEPVLGRNLWHLR